MFWDEITSDQFESCKNDIKEVSILPENELRRIYNLIRESGCLPKIVILDLRDNYNKANIFNLKSPK